MDYRMCGNADNYQGYQQQAREWVPQMESSPMSMPSPPYHRPVNSLPGFETTFSDGRAKEEYYGDCEQTAINGTEIGPSGVLEYFYPNDQSVPMKSVYTCKKESDSCFGEELDFDLDVLSDFSAGLQHQPTDSLYHANHEQHYMAMNFLGNAPMQMEQSRSPSNYDNASMVSMSPPAPSPCYFNWNNDLGSDGRSSTSGTPPPSPPVQKIKKPRRTNKRKKGHLWEFVLNLLKDPETNPSIVKWEDKKLGIFRFVKSKEAAKLWGIKKENKEMTYEKMSRAMRYTREVGVFSHLPDAYLMRRLCYRFGERAEGWVEVAQSTNTTQQ